MKIFNNNNINNDYSNMNVIFKAGGKPLSIDYILKKHNKILPARIFNEAKNPVFKESSLMELHKNVYSNLLDCESMREVRAIYPEFANVKDEVVFQKGGKRQEEFKKKTGDNFVLNALKMYWSKLMTVDEIAKYFNFKNRTSMMWAFNQVNFPRFEKNYKTILKASDEEGNKIIAQKQTAWNAEHQEEMYARNKHAAQGCKTEKYRAEQSFRIRQYDKEHPERIEKIRDFDKRVWDLCPEVKALMSACCEEESACVKSIVKKTIEGKCLSRNEDIIHKAFFKHFWEKHPECKETYKNAKAQVREELKQERSK